MWNLQQQQNQDIKMRTNFWNGVFSSFMYPCMFVCILWFYQHHSHTNKISLIHSLLGVCSTYRLVVSHFSQEGFLCKVSGVAAASCPASISSTCLYGCCCSISAVGAVRICGFVFLPHICPQLSHHSAGESAYPSSSLFSPSLLHPTPPSFLFHSQALRETSAG